MELQLTKIWESLLDVTDITTQDNFFDLGGHSLLAMRMVAEIETTFGNQNYIFPPTNEMVDEAREYIQSELDDGRNIVLLGYTLGKAQKIMKIVEGLGVPVFVYDKIRELNKVYEKYKINLGSHQRISAINGGQFILVHPPSRSFALDRFRNRNTTFVGFSGWAFKNEYKYWIGADRVFPMSDHADFMELLDTVRKCDPKKIYTLHGFSTEFAELLKVEGYDCEPL